MNQCNIVLKWLSQGQKNQVLKYDEVFWRRYLDIFFSFRGMQIFSMF